MADSFMASMHTTIRAGHCESSVDRPSMGAMGARSSVPQRRLVSMPAPLMVGLLSVDQLAPVWQQQLSPMLLASVTRTGAGTLRRGPSAGKLRTQLRCPPPAPSFRAQCSAWSYPCEPGVFQAEARQMSWVPPLPLQHQPLQSLINPPQGSRSLVTSGVGLGCCRRCSESGHRMEKSTGERVCKTVLKTN